jgi:hypothetical protein
VLPTLIDLLSVKIEDEMKQIEFQTEVYERYKELMIGS